MPAKRYQFGGPLNELDYARAIDPLSRSGPAMASFIKGIAVTSGILVVGSVATAMAYAYYKPRRQFKIAPEDKVRVGILGTGWGITVQLPQFRKGGLEVTAVFSRGQQRARQVADQNHIKLHFSSAEDLCLCEEVDCHQCGHPTLPALQAFPSCS
ncbi:Glucose-fructose oxidoreductase domain-containing protein 1 [Trebouxia sp. C0010 RCD-2024]